MIIYRCEARNTAAYERLISIESLIKTTTNQLVFTYREEADERNTAEKCGISCESSQFGEVFRPFIKDIVQLKQVQKQAVCRKCIHLFFHGALEHIQGLKIE